ncbi:MAG: universal stress protein [Hyphomicrobiaceae bacterium]
MYKNILVATDGTDLSAKAVQHGITLAKTVGAKVVGVTVTIPFDAYMTSEVAVAMDTNIFEERTAAMAKRCLDAVKELAERERVPCVTIRSQDDPIYEGIIDTAEKQRCDLIIMASHGRRGFTGLLLGSETTKVLTHSKIPVLVVR